MDNMQLVQEIMMHHAAAGRVMDGETALGFPVMALFGRGDVLDGVVVRGAVPVLVVPVAELIVRGDA
jgi:hypothetical protein